MSVLLETSLGDLTIDLYTEERPQCSLNFIKLCKIKYYNFCLFHSVQKNLVAQSGDPTGTGRGGESIFSRLYGHQARYFDWEVKPKIKHRRRGLVSMVNNGDNQHGSQFFITLADGLDYLDGVHTVFGELAEGSDVLETVNETYCDGEHRPYKDILIYHTVILDDPFPDPPTLEVPSRSPSPPAAVLESARIGAEENLVDETDEDAQAAAVRLQQQEARANAQILEMIGDIPEADIKPPDNVLFVCKLNAVTTEEDLEVIFSRFGAIKKCEVIKNHKTGDSLQYAFVEFEDSDSCEQAYFKMDNVLIDDRRIHVDFSQSVSKEWNQYRRDGKFQNSDDDKPDSGSSKKVAHVPLKQQGRRDQGGYELLFNEDTEESRTNHKSRRRSRSRSRDPQKNKHDRDSERHQDRKKEKERSREDRDHRHRRHHYRHHDDRHSHRSRHRQGTRSRSK